MQAERAQESRRKILEAAREIFFRDGFEAANLDEVAQRAGIAKRQSAARFIEFVPNQHVDRA